jgi:hypothetical protein
MIKSLMVKNHKWSKKSQGIKRRRRERTRRPRRPGSARSGPTSRCAGPARARAGGGARAPFPRARSRAGPWSPGERGGSCARARAVMRSMARGDARAPHRNTQLPPAVNAAGGDARVHSGEQSAMAATHTATSATLG